MSQGPKFGASVSSGGTNSHSDFWQGTVYTPSTRKITIAVQGW